MKSHERDLTRGSILKHLFVMGIPVMLGLFMHNLYSLADLFWVKNLGVPAKAAVLLCSLLFFVVFSVSQVFGMGTLAIVSRKYGQKKPLEAQVTTRNAVFIAIVIGAIITGLNLYFAPQVVTLIGAKGNVVPPALEYLKPFCIGFMFQLVALTLNFAVRGTGDMKTPMLIMVISTVSNIILDPIMIFGWGPFPAMGIAGAGAATAISQALAAVFAIVAVIFGITPLKVPFTFKFRPDWKEIGRILRIGLPAGLQFFILSLSFFILIRIVAEYGEYAVDALGTTWRILHSASIPVIGFGAAVATMVGQNLGSGNPERAEETTITGIKAAVLFAGVILAFYVTWPRFFIGVFSNSEEVIELGAMALRIMGISQLFIAASIIFQHCFTGSGDTVPTMIAAIARVIVMVFLALILPAATGLGIFALIICIPISSLSGLLVFILFYRKGDWKTRMSRLEESSITDVPV